MEDNFKTCLIGDEPSGSASIATAAGAIHSGRGIVSTPPPKPDLRTFIIFSDGMKMLVSDHAEDATANAPRAAAVAAEIERRRKLGRFKFVFGAAAGMAKSMIDAAAIMAELAEIKSTLARIEVAIATSKKSPSKNLVVAPQPVSKVWPMELPSWLPGRVAVPMLAAAFQASEPWVRRQLRGVVSGGRYARTEVILRLSAAEKILPEEDELHHQKRG